MSACSRYTFTTVWTVHASVHQVASVLRDVESFPRWWQPVYMKAVVLTAGDEHGVGREVDLATRGFLPYVLRWRLRVTEVSEPHWFAFVGWGDLEGEGNWRLSQSGPCVTMRLEWRVSARKPLIRMLSVALRPVFVQNHAWAMTRGQTGLARELHRRFADESCRSGPAS